MSGRRIHAAARRVDRHRAERRRVSLPANYISIIEQTRRATANGVKLDWQASIAGSVKRTKRCEKPARPLDSYRQAMNLDPTHSLRLQRKVIDLQLAQDDTAPAEHSLDEYLKSRQLADSERSWALGQKANILIDAGQFRRSTAIARPGVEALQWIRSCRAK